MANQLAGKASSEISALKPYRGKPAVRNFRGDDGNIGIIRSPNSAFVLPDTGETGKSVEDEKASEGFIVAKKRSNVRGAKEPCCL
jgi:hypothetical protein